MAKQKNLVVKYWDFTKPMICQTFQSLINKKVAFIFRESFINRDTLAANDSYKKLLGVVNDESTEATSWRSEITDNDDLTKIIKRTKEVIEDYDINDSSYNGVRLSLAVSDTLNGARVVGEKYVFKRNGADNTKYDIEFEKLSTVTGQELNATPLDINIWGGYNQKIVQSYYNSKKPKVEITFPTEASDTDRSRNPEDVKYPYKKELEYDKNTTTFADIQDKFYHFAILKITRIDTVTINEDSEAVLSVSKGDINAEFVDISSNDISSGVIDWDIPSGKVAWSCCEKPISIDKYVDSITQNNIMDNIMEYELIENDNTQGGD